MTISDSKIAALAKIVHQANKAFCECIGDTSQVDWDDAPDDIKQSVIIGVKAICDDPTMTPERSHVLWSDTKTKAGWVYGPKKDTAAKTHPCLVPYAELDNQQKFKDHLFYAIVKSYLDFPKE